MTQFQNDMNPAGYNPNNHYQQNYNGFNTASLVLCSLGAFGALSTLFGMNLMVLIPSGLSILFAVLSKGKSTSFSKTNKIVITVAIISMIIGIVATVYSFYYYLYTPVGHQELNDTYQNYLGISFDDFLEQYKSGEFFQKYK